MRHQFGQDPVFPGLKKIARIRTILAVSHFIGEFTVEFIHNCGKVAVRDRQVLTRARVPQRIAEAGVVALMAGNPFLDDPHKKRITVTIINDGFHFLQVAACGPLVPQLMPAP
mgnify:FL=1